MSDNIPRLTLNNDVTLPAFGFGVFQATPEETAGAVKTALRTGYRHIDTAAAYFNEREVGECRRRSGSDRDEVFLETMIWLPDYGREATRPGRPTQHSGGPGDPPDRRAAREVARAGDAALAPRPGPAGDPHVRACGPRTSTCSTSPLSAEELAEIDGLDTGVRGGPDPESITLAEHSMEIPEG